MSIVTKEVQCVYLILGLQVIHHREHLKFIMKLVRLFLMWVFIAHQQPVLNF